MEKPSEEKLESIARRNRIILLASITAIFALIAVSLGGFSMMVANTYSAAPCEHVPNQIIIVATVIAFAIVVALIVGLGLTISASHRKTQIALPIIAVVTTILGISLYAAYNSRIENAYEITNHGWIHSSADEYQTGGRYILPTEMC